VRGEVVDVVVVLEGETERWLVVVREGLKAVLRRRREPVVLFRSGVKDWKRFVRLGEGIFVVRLVGKVVSPCFFLSFRKRSMV
jgi:hypothetical protein